MSGGYLGGLMPELSQVSLQGAVLSGRQVEQVRWGEHFTELRFNLEMVGNL